MALDGTYAGLQASVGDFLNRSDLLSSIPDFIRIAEFQMNRRIRAADMVTATTLVVSTSSVALPSDFNGMVAIELPSGSGTPLRYLRPEEARALKQNLYSATGVPWGYTISGTNLETVPPPGQSYTCPMLYYSRIPALTNSNTTNWLVTKHGDAYLFGALSASAPYLKDDERVPIWKGLFEDCISNINANDGRVSYGHALTPPVRGAAVPEGTAAQ